MTYQTDIEKRIQAAENMTASTAQELNELRVLSNNTAVLRAPNYPLDFISGFEWNINAEWHQYPLKRSFIVDTDQEVLITTDAVLQSYGVLIQFSYSINGNQWAWYPGVDDGMFFDRRYGSTLIHSIGRKQGVQFLKIPRGEYELQGMYCLHPDVMYQGLAGIAEVSIGVRGL